MRAEQPLLFCSSCFYKHQLPFYDDYSIWNCFGTSTLHMAVYLWCEIIQIVLKLQFQDVIRSLKVIRLLSGGIYRTCNLLSISRCSLQLKNFTFTVLFLHLSHFDLFHPNPGDLDDRLTSLALCWLHWCCPTSLSTLGDPEHGPLGRVTSAPPPDLYLLASPLFFPHCLLFPDRDGADCVSLTASAASIPHGTPLTMTCLSAPTGSLWQPLLGKWRRRESKRRRAPWGRGWSMEGRWLRRGRCLVLINMVMFSAMTSHRKARGQPHRKWNLIETH